MALIQDQLGQLVGKELLVVMADSKAFKGTLASYDNEFMLLENTMETSIKDVRWKPVTVPAGTREGRLKVQVYDPGADVMDTGQNVAILKRVLVNLGGTLRIWLWEPETYKPKELGEVGSISF